MDPAQRAFHQTCNYITNMRKACLFLFERFEHLTDYNAVYVRGEYRRRGTLGFVVNSTSLADCFSVIEWFQTQFQSKRHSFYRYTIDIIDGHERLSIFISPHWSLKNMLFKSKESQVPLSVFLSRLNNLDLDDIKEYIEGSVGRRGEQPYRRSAQ